MSINMVELAGMPDEDQFVASDCLASLHCSEGMEVGGAQPPAWQTPAAQSALLFNAVRHQ